jgi:mRNA-degrading endonuclease RelE of RelBE toxin-antitoxin system
MIYKVILKKKVTKFLKTCEKHIRDGFFEKSQILAKDPFSARKRLDIDKIEGEDSTTIYRLRI